MQPHYSAFIDESSALRSADRQEYLICAALVPMETAEEIREKLLPLKMKGQIKLHWSDEDQSRRRKIVAAVAELEPMSAVVTHTSQPQRKTERFRRKCLETIYYELSSMGVRNVICESRMTSQDKSDVAHLLKLRNQKILVPEFDITHCRVWASNPAVLLDPKTCKPMSDCLQSLAFVMASWEDDTIDQQTFDHVRAVLDLLDSELRRSAQEDKHSLTPGAAVAFDCERILKALHRRIIKDAAEHPV